MPRFAGRVESWEEGVVSGWAVDHASPDSALELGLYDGEELLLRFAAALPRPDLVRPGFGNGRHGFRVTFPPGLLVRERHLFRIRMIGAGHELPGSPHVYRRSVPILDMDALAAARADLRARLAESRDFGRVRDAVATLFSLLGEALPVFERLRANLPAPQDGAIDLAHSHAPAIAAILTDLAARYEALTFDATPDPVVSVIVPVHARFALTYQCLRALALHPPAVSWEVIVVDDASMDETVFLPTIARGLRFHRLDAACGAVAARNAGAAMARGTYLAFLAQDAEPLPGWLDALHAALAADAELGLAGAKLVDAAGLVIEAGGRLGPLGDRTALGQGLPAAHPELCRLRAADDVSAAAMMMPAELFASVGGFDAGYVAGTGEDSDLALGVRTAGRGVACQGLAVVRRHDAAPVAPGRRLFARWREVLAAPALPAVRILVIAATAPEGDSAADLLALRRAGFEVVLAQAGETAPEAALRVLQDGGVVCLGAPFCASAEEALRRHGAQSAAILLDGAAIAAAYGPLARLHAPGVRVVARMDGAAAGVDGAVAPDAGIGPLEAALIPPG